MTPKNMPAMKNTGPPTTDTVTNVVATDRPLITLRPKLSGRLLSMPVQLCQSTDAVSVGTGLAFKILPEAVQKPATGNSIVEPNVCEEDTLKKPYSHG